MGKKKKQDNGHDEVAATGAEIIEKLICKKDAPDRIKKDAPYLIAASISSLRPVWSDPHDRLWVEYGKWLEKVYDPVWSFPEDK